MAVFLSDEVLDQGLDYLDTNGTQLNICTQLPTSYSEATTEDAYSVGVKTSLNIGATSDKAGGGRECIIPEITDGAVNTATSDTATHWAITDGASLFIAAGTLSAPQVVTDGNTFTLTAFAIGIPDAA